MENVHNEEQEEGSRSVHLSLNGEGVYIFVFPFLVLVSFTLCAVLLCPVSCVESEPLPLLAMSSVVIGLSPLLPLHSLLWYVLSEYSEVL